ncbi:MAG: DUF4197 domain-containing protein [Hyphomonadaceae bacterium]
MSLRVALGGLLTILVSHPASAQQAETPVPAAGVADTSATPGSVGFDFIAPPTAEEASEDERALREMLSLAVVGAADRLGGEGGFYADPEARIDLPGSLPETQLKLRPFGMSGSLDDLQVRLNHAASETVPIVLAMLAQAVGSLRFDAPRDVIEAEGAVATDHLSAMAGPHLADALRPSLEAALGEAGAFSALEDVVQSYPIGEPRADARRLLVDQTLSGLLDGMFYYIAREEETIRSSPDRRGSDLMRRVFGG